MKWTVGLGSTIINIVFCFIFLVISYQQSHVKTQRRLGGSYCDKLRDNFHLQMIMKAKGHLDFIDRLPALSRPSVNGHVTGSQTAITTATGQSGWMMGGGVVLLYTIVLSCHHKAPPLVWTELSARQLEQFVRSPARCAIVRPSVLTKMCVAVFTTIGMPLFGEVAFCRHWEDGNSVVLDTSRTLQSLLLSMPWFPSERKSIAYNPSETWKR